MKRACLSILAAIFLLLTHLQPIVFGQSTGASSPADPAVEKVRQAVGKIGMAQKITVFLKNGDALHGAVTKIDRDEFAIAEVDFQRISTIQYKDVKKIRSGYGEINLITGKRVSPPKAARIAVMAGLLFLIIGLPTIVLATTKD